MSAALKRQVYQACVSKLTEQLAELDSAMDKVRESIDGEDKSSAGDKYETARAMAQTEMERLAIQQAKVRNEIGTLQLIDPERTTSHVQLGSLVQTSQKLLFVAVALGRVEVDGSMVFVVSPGSPIGQQIIGQTTGHTFKLGPSEDTIRSIS